MRALHYPFCLYLVKSLYKTKPIEMAESWMMVGNHHLLLYCNKRGVEPIIDWGPKSSQKQEKKLQKTIFQSPKYVILTRSWTNVLIPSFCLIHPYYSQSASTICGHTPEHWATLCFLHSPIPSWCHVTLATMVTRNSVAGTFKLFTKRTELREFFSLPEVLRLATFQPVSIFW